MSGAARSEPPTPRRLREARARGDVARSAELTGAAALLGGLAGAVATGPSAWGELARLVRGALAAAPAASPDPAAVLRAGAAAVLRLSLGPGLAALAAGAVAGALQTGGGLFPAALRPRLDRIDPARGLRRLASPASLLRAALGAGKALVLLAIAAAWLRGTAGLAELPRAAPGAAARAAPALLSLALRLAAAFAVLGAIDLAVARRRRRRALMMTRDEVRRDLREDEGDPAHRAERRRRHRALVDAGPLARATVVVVNPTHVAVALRHERDGDDPPRVVAKGAGLAAARLRSAARRAGVPVVRDVPLARALHRLAEVGDDIPGELYDAAATLLAHLYRVPEAP